MLLLGGDLSGGGAAQRPSLTVSNAITNLASGTLGELKRIAPMPAAGRAKWQREMGWYTAMCEQIVVRRDAVRLDDDGERVEFVESVMREDVASALPLLRDVDDLVVAVLDGYDEAERGFTYRKREQGEGGAWWNEVPVVPKGGLDDERRAVLDRDRVALALALERVSDLNAATLARMEVPQDYLRALPQNAKQLLPRDLYRALSMPVRPDLDDFVAKFRIDGPDAALATIEHLESALLIWGRKGGAAGGTAATAAAATGGGGSPATPAMASSSTSGSAGGTCSSPGLGATLKPPSGSGMHSSRGSTSSLVDEPLADSRVPLVPRLQGYV
jgi:hypothetical protein